MEVGGFEGKEYTEPFAGVSTGEDAPLTIQETAVLVPVTTNAGKKFDLKVFVQGNQEDVPIITCHEIGLNHKVCYTNFLSNKETEPLVRKCCFYHIDFPGQSEGDPDMFNSKSYPSMDDLGNWIGDVAKYFKLPTFFAMGVGAGAYVLFRYISSKHTTDPAIRGVLAISPVVRAPTWREWTYDKLARTQLAVSPAGQVPAFVVQQNLAGFFGPQTLSSHLDLVQQFTHHLTKTLNPSNYSAFRKAWTNRTDLHPILMDKKIAVPLLAFYGGNSMRKEEILDCVGAGGVFSSPRTTLVQVWKSADLVHQDSAQEVAEAFKLFFRGFSIMM